MQSLLLVSSDRVNQYITVRYITCVNYVFMNRYMVTASIRADGSSRLVDKWSYFPSAALAWDLKQESF